MPEPRPLPEAPADGLRALRVLAAASLLSLSQITAAEAEMKIESSAFAAGGDIPVVHTCKGSDVSPPLSWSDIPAGTKSLALIVDDPDAPDPAAPKRTWVHWVVYDLPPTTMSLAEGAGGNDAAAPARAGLNDWARKSYGGPCPPIGRHRYYFKLYALDAVLGDLGDANKAVLEKAMEGHVLARAELVGTFQK